MKSLAIKSEFTIRSACNEDKQEIAILVNQAFAEYREGKNVSHLEENLQDISRDIEKNEVLILEKENEIIGTLRLESRGENIYYLKRFAIHPQYQGQGLGAILFKEAEKVVKNHNSKTIYLHSSTEDNRLIKFYEKLGLRCIEIEKNIGYARGLWIKKLK